MADQSITDYTAATALDRADLVEVVQDVTTTPVNKKATVDVLDPGRTLGGTAGRSVDVAVGTSASANPTADDQFGRQSVAVGDSSSAPGEGDTAVGGGAQARGGRSVAVGYDADAQAGRSIAIGNGAFTDGASGGVAIGDATDAQGGAVCIGDSAVNNADFFGGVCIGQDSTAGSTTRAVVVGSDASTTASDVVVLGHLASASAVDSVALGYGADAAHADSVAIGHDTTTTADDQVMVGPRDIEITGTVKGLVLEDRTLGTRHRVYLDDGVLEIEAA